MLWNKYNERRVTTEFSNLDVEKNGQWSDRGRENGKKKNWRQHVQTTFWISFAHKSEEI